MSKKKARLVVAIGIKKDGTYELLSQNGTTPKQVSKLLRDLSQEVLTNKPNKK